MTGTDSHAAPAAIVIEGGRGMQAVIARVGGGITRHV